MPSSGYRLALRRALFLGAGCILFAYLLVQLGPGEILALLLRIGWSFAVIVTFYAGYNMVRAFALGTCIVGEDRISYWDLVKIRLAGEALQFLTFTGQFLAEPAKALLLRNRGLPGTHAFAGAISEYLIYTFTSAAMTIVGPLYFLHNFEVPRSASVAAWIVIGVSGIFLSAAVVAIVGRIYLIGAIVKAVGRLPGVGKYLQVDGMALRGTEDLLFVVLRSRPWRFLWIVAVELAAQMLLILELFVLLRFLEQPFPAIFPFLIEAATKFISVGFFFIPGQVGAAEGVYALIFQSLGLAASVGFSLALARRVRSLAIAGVGLFFLVVWKSRAGDEMLEHTADPTEGGEEQN